MSDKKRVLVVEDDHILQKVAAMNLQGFDVHVETAPHGKKALEKMQKLGFALVLMDIHMPEMNGIEATKQIRESEKGTGRHVPIVGVSADPELERQALAAGMDEFVLKPADYKRIATRWLV
jgi:CheY-like chemotaxis protein